MPTDTSGIRSLFIATDIDVLWENARVTQRDGYLVVEHVGSPNHYWGNFLVFDAPPQPGDRERWEALFERELPAECYHRTFAWDCPVGADEQPPRGAIGEFLAAGYEEEGVLTLVARAGDVVRPPRCNDDVEVVCLDPDDDAVWQQVIESDVASRPDGHTEAAFLEYAGKQFQHRRAMLRAGLGSWLAVRIDGRIAANLGVFVFDGGRGRFQAVGTHPDFRRRGLCGRLVYDAAHHAFDQLGANELVMVADPDYHAARIYEACGFRPVERAVGVCEWKRGQPA